MRIYKTVDQLTICIPSAKFEHNEATNGLLIPNTSSDRGYVTLRYRESVTLPRNEQRPYYSWDVSSPDTNGGKWANVIVAAGCAYHEPLLEQLEGA